MDGNEAIKQSMKIDLKSSTHFKYSKGTNKDRDQMYKSGTVSEAANASETWQD